MFITRTTACRGWGVEWRAAIVQEQLLALTRPAFNLKRRKTRKCAERRGYDKGSEQKKNEKERRTDKNASFRAKGLYRLGSGGGDVIFYGLDPDLSRGPGLKLYPLRVTSPTAYKFSHEKSDRAAIPSSPLETFKKYLFFFFFFSTCFPSPNIMYIFFLFHVSWFLPPALDILFSAYIFFSWNRPASVYTYHLFWVRARAHVCVSVCYSFDKHTT